MPKPRAKSLPSLVIVAGLLLVFFVTSWCAWLNKSATYDEPLHLTAAWLQVHFDDFRCDPEDPPLWRYYLALGTNKNRLSVATSGVVWDAMLANRAVEGLYFKDVLYHTPGNDADAVIAAARARMLLLGVILGGVICAWAWRLGGAGAGVVALAVFCFDPNFLAHAALIKNDVPESLALLVFAAGLWLLGERATPPRWVAISLSLAAALTIKFSGVLAIPVLAAALLTRALLAEPWQVWKWTLRTRLGRLVAAAVLTAGSCAIAYVCIWACYGFRYAPSSDPARLFDFNELLQIARNHDSFAANNAFTLTAAQQQEFFARWRPGLILRLGLWANQWHLFPQTFLEGFLFTYGTSPGRAAFLLGVNAVVGRWYYFPIAMLVKTPLATILACILAAVYWIRKRWSASRWWDIVALGLLPAVYLATAMASDLNLGIRHILPIFPFLFIVLGTTAAGAARRFGKPAIVVTVLLLLGVAMETVAAYPDFIPFFNIAAGGWRNGPNLLGDSNLDWGQDLPAIADWQRQHAQFQLFLAYFGSADPRYYQIHYVKLPGGDGPEDESEPDSRPRVYAVSANVPHSPWLSSDQRDFYKKLQSQKPVAVLGHCIYLYNSPVE